MPIRMLRDWTDSDRVNSVSVHAERFLARLIMKADDYGCFHADTRLLKANLFPLLLDSVREADLLRWMAECQKAGLIVLYETSNKKYLQIVNFKQRLDRAKSKFPLPPTDLSGSQEFTNEPQESAGNYLPETETEIETDIIQAPKKKRKVKQTVAPQQIPTLEDVRKYFDEKGHYESLADDFYNNYDASSWVDKNGYKVTNWKQKAIQVWFKGAAKKPEKKEIVRHIPDNVEKNDWL